MNHIKKSLALFLLAALIWGCGSSIALFDQYAYSQTTSIKVDVLNLMDKSTEPYATHQQEVEKVIADVMKMKEYERNRPKDNITFAMWNTMLDSTNKEGLVGRFFEKWKKDGPERPALIADTKKMISRGFDFIAELESNKLKPNDSNVLKFLKK